MTWWRDAGCADRACQKGLLDQVQFHALTSAGCASQPAGAFSKCSLPAYCTHEGTCLASWRGFLRGFLHNTALLRLICAHLELLSTGRVHVMGATGGLDKLQQSAWRREAGRSHCRVHRTAGAAGAEHGEQEE